MNLRASSGSRRFILSIFLSLNLGFADEVVALKGNVEQWSFGETVFGDLVRKQDLQGKVVAMEYWGVECPNCLESLPRLVEVDRKYRDRGLRVIAAEVCESSKSRIGKIVDQFGVGFTVTDGMSGPVSVTGLPFALVFDPRGEMLFKGNPKSPKFEQMIREALTNVKPSSVKPTEIQSDSPSGDLIALRTWTNHEGRPLEASVTKVAEGKVFFRLTTGKTVSYEIEKLSKQDQQFLRERVNPSSF